jgi:hypothetical protein
MNFLPGLILVFFLVILSACGHTSNPVAGISPEQSIAGVPRTNRSEPQEIVLLEPTLLVSETRPLNPSNYWVVWQDPNLGYIAASRVGVPVTVPNYPPNSLSRTTTSQSTPQLFSPLGDPLTSSCPVPTPDPTPTSNPEPAPDLTPTPLPTPTPTSEPIISEVFVDFETPPPPVTLPLTPGGDPITLTVFVTTPKDAASVDSDIVLLQDLSGSFSDDLPVLRAIAPDVVSAFPQACFGVSSFVDKPIEPFGSPPGDYVYRTDLPVSCDANGFISTINGLQIFSGGDIPESQSVTPNRFEQVDPGATVSFEVTLQVAAGATDNDRVVIRIVGTGDLIIDVDIRN